MHITAFYRIGVALQSISQTNKSNCLICITSEIFLHIFQVIAVVMDTFTDVDIFADLLDATARHIPVYILLDEQEAHNFVSMVINCKVNLDLIQVTALSGVYHPVR